MEQKTCRQLTAAATVGAALALRAIWNRAREYQLCGKTVLITGGSRGLGLVLAREFAAEGANLVICARDAEALERARAELAAAGAQVLTAPCDVTDRKQVAELVAAARQRFGAIDVLVNNAGLIQVGPLEAQTLEDFEASINLHFWAPLYTTLAVLPEMQARREGRIVNIASIGGKISTPHLLPYCCGKFALVGLSEGLRAELAKDNVRVTTVTPGLMRTGSPLQASFKGKHREEYAWFSISDSLPMTSISAERAARQILAACKRGEAELAISWLAQFAIPLYGMFPGPGADLLGVLNRLLPSAEGTGTRSFKGFESETPMARKLAASSYAAAQRNNELG
ncbi:MAG: SDR family NAD(P)-dependent oxidoreductase [Actinomycetota bacterium]